MNDLISRPDSRKYATFPGVNYRKLTKININFTKININFKFRESDGM